MVVTLETRIAITVFAAGVLVALIALAGCGGADSPPSSPQAGGEMVSTTNDETLIPNQSASRRAERHCREGTRVQPWVAGRFYNDRTRLRLGFMSGGNEACGAGVGTARPYAFIATLRVAERKGEELDVIQDHCVDLILPEPAPPRFRPSDLKSVGQRNPFRLTPPERRRLVAAGQECQVIEAQQRYG